MQNRRKDVRVPLRAQVNCVSDFHTFRGVTRNVSQNGIQVELPALRKTANVHLTLRLPLSDALIDATGTVIWVSGKRSGIKFKYMGEQSQESIRQFIEERKSGSV